MPVPTLVTFLTVLLGFWPLCPSEMALRSHWRPVFGKVSGPCPVLLGPQQCLTELPELPASPAPACPGRRCPLVCLPCPPLRTWHGAHPAVPVPPTGACAHSFLSPRLAHCPAPSGLCLSPLAGSPGPDSPPCSPPSWGHCAHPSKGAFQQLTPAGPLPVTSPHHGESRFPQEKVHRPCILLVSLHFPCWWICTRGTPPPRV